MMTQVECDHLPHISVADPVFPVGGHRPVREVDL